MTIPIYQVDAFTNQLFCGNPAAICILMEWLDDNLLAKIAQENNLAETAYIIQNDDYFDIRWFMPHAEINLCGHATLASAHVIFNELNYPKNEILFQSKSGILKATKSENNTITLDFPAWETQPTPITKLIQDVFGAVTIVNTEKARDLIIELATEEEVKNCNPDSVLMREITDYVCLIITAKGTNSDFVSRVFDGKANPIEDPVTGSAHSSLVPYWSKRLKKNDLHALQLSKRQGEIFCKHQNNRVFMKGNSVLYLKGEIYL